MDSKPLPPAATPFQLPETSERVWVVAVLLCLFLGYLGVHRFYTGRILLGLGLLVTLGGFGIGWAIDFILLLFGASKDDKGLYVKP